MVGKYVELVCDSPEKKYFHISNEWEATLIPARRVLYIGFKMCHSCINQTIEIELIHRVWLEAGISATRNRVSH